MDVTEDDAQLIREALASGVDLKDYSEKVRAELSGVRIAAVADVAAQAENLVALHQQIVNADSVFERLEKMLVGFQTDLSGVSQHMKRLQGQSASLSTELENRQKVRTQLAQFIDDAVVPPNMVKVITEMDPSEPQWSEQLHELQRKLQFAKTHEFHDARPVQDVQPVLAHLKSKAVSKAREWILTRVYQFRKPLSNYQIPQHSLLKNRFFYEFLLANDRAVADEVREQYLDTVSKMFFSYFKAYLSRLFKLLMNDVATKDDVLGAEDQVKSSFFSSKATVRSRAAVFTLGNRRELLTTGLLAPLLVPHVLQQHNHKLQWEAIFRSVQLALADHASHEYLFLTDFFLVSGESAIALHASAMGRALAHLTQMWTAKAAENWDAISLYLCICLSARFRLLMTERQVPALDDYWDGLLDVLWKQLDVVMRLHVSSLNAVDPKKLQSPVDTRPHYMVRRWAELVSGLLAVNESWSGEVGPKLEALLENAEDALERLLQRMAATQSGGGGGNATNNIAPLVLLVNNYDLVLTTLDERVARDTKLQHSLAEHEQTLRTALSTGGAGPWGSYRARHQRLVTQLADQLLRPHFASLITFVTDAEQLLAQGQAATLEGFRDRALGVVRDFGAVWKRALETINAEIVQSFTNFKCGTHVLQTTLTSLVSYYQRFVRLLAHDSLLGSSGGGGGGGSTTIEPPVPMHVLMGEVKKYKPVY